MDHVLIDDTQVSSHTAIHPTHKLPNEGEDLASVQQDHRQSLNATSRYSTPHSQTSHHHIPSKTAIVGSDVNRTFACEDVGVDRHESSSSRRKRAMGYYNAAGSTHRQYGNT
ncbi:hypothetical protein M378DRAFT_181959 [Amanita muscaria Koide BX008]|uniref:Uncharacterized protein n=1 Tax=Amanita muscaria (strain Koide BX008) TaxID=946122 RepID=A0A0C2WJW7_AMAMK|nr:hypothetical protein M378DRAFT_181959 [Amanita muscaria Koide BX008]